MRVSKLKIRNFRCFGSIETVIELNDLTALIGANSCGKTAALQALLKIFGKYGAERELTRADFHVPKGTRPEEITSNSLSIEAILDFPELNSSEELSKTTVPPFFTRMIIDHPGGDPFVRIRLEAKWEKSNTPEGNIETKFVFITVPEGTKGEESDENRVPVSSEHKSNIQVIYVPAIREPTHQLRNASGTILYRILNGVKWPEDIEEKISAKIAEVDLIFDEQEGIRKIQEIIKTQWNSLHKDSRYSEARVKFNHSDLETILQRIDVEFAPTETPRAYNIDSLGEGLRSLFYFSLVNSLLEIEAYTKNELGKNEGECLFNFFPPALTLLLIEEPENHISPQLLGKVMQNVHQISIKKNAQVVITSHTPAIIKRVQPESIRHLRINKANHCTVVNKIRLPEEKDEAYKFVREAVISYPEIYFSRLVILGEGDTESLVIPKVVESLGPSLDSSGVAVVPLGHRFVNHFWKLLMNIEIPFVTILDIDIERHGGGYGRIKYVIDQLINTGVEKNDILKLSSGSILPESDFQVMGNWSVENKEKRELLNGWAEYLIRYNVFFASPLDFDFAMLSSFPEIYKGIASAKGGPRIPKKSETDKYNERLIKDIASALKEEGGNGNSYTLQEKELFPWYVYLFLNRSKPSTHLLAISKIDDDLLKANMPDFLKKLLDKIQVMLKDDPISALEKPKR